MLVLQEFDLDIKGKSGVRNQVADHLRSKEDEIPIFDKFPDEFLYVVNGANDIPWFVNIVNYLVSVVVPKKFSKFQDDKLKYDAKYYLGDYLWRFSSDKVIRRCVNGHKIPNILDGCHNSTVGGHFGPQRIARKVLDRVFFWRTTFKDAHAFVSKCKKCQRVGGNITKKMKCPSNH